MMVRLTLLDDTPAFINYNNITAIVSTKEGTKIFTTDGRNDTFKENYVEVVEKFISDNTRQGLLPELYDEFGAQQADKRNS